jgi:hypothetical protein
VIFSLPISSLYSPVCDPTHAADEQLEAISHGSRSLRFLKRILNNDKRRATRRACDIDGSIRQEGSFKSYACQVLDISDNGVRLTANDAHRIPNSFLFFLNKSGLGRAARVRWRRGTQIGAELQTAAITSPVDKAADKIHRSLVGAGAAASVVVLILMYALAGPGGAGVTLSIILLFLGLRTAAAGS